MTEVAHAGRVDGSEASSSQKSKKRCRLRHRIERNQGLGFRVFKGLGSRV